MNCDITVDVIIPTHNRAYVLSRAIESVLSQTYKKFQLYVIDDGSTDDTDTLMEKFAQTSNIHYLKQVNKGVSSARNSAIHRSKNPWICFLDSDDEWLPHKLQSQINYILNNQDYEFVHSNEIWVRNGVRVNAKKKFDKTNNELFKRSLETCLISPSTVMIKRDLIVRLGLFNDEFPVCEDYDLWLKVQAVEKIGFIEDGLIKKNGGHVDQLSTQYPAMDYWRIRSLINLQQNFELSPEMRSCAATEIQKKAGPLLKGYLKHQNIEAYEELLSRVLTYLD